MLLGEPHLLPGFAENPLGLPPLRAVRALACVERPRCLLGGKTLRPEFVPLLLGGEQSGEVGRKPYAGTVAGQVIRAGYRRWIRSQLLIRETVSTKWCRQV